MSKSYLEGMHLIEQPLKDGHTLKCFSSGFNLRVARILAPEGQLVGYGEATTLDIALADAAENYVTGEDYGRQYRDANARYRHRIYGRDDPVSPIDKHISQGGKLLARWTNNILQVELHRLTEIPSLDAISPENNDYPRIITQYNRQFLLEVTDNSGIMITPIPTPGVKIDAFIDLVRIGEGRVFSDAVNAALQAESCESPINHFR